MRIKSFLLFVLMLNLYLFSGAQYIKGSVTDQYGMELPFANVYVKNSSYGTSTDYYGDYFLELKPGTYTLIYSYIGYETLEKQISVKSKQGLEVDVSLKEASTKLGEVEIVVKKEDRAKEIMKQARKNRKFLRDQIQNYQCQTYNKTSLEKELVKYDSNDLVSAVDSNDPKVVRDFAEKLKNEKLNLRESVSETYFRSPSNYKVIVLAHHDYVEKNIFIGQSVSVGAEIGGDDIVPQQGKEENPYILYNDINSCDFNFYNNYIKFPSICSKPLLSPIASNANLSYDFKFVESFEEDGQVIYKIEVIPYFKTEALFNGYIYIIDGSWAIKAVDLAINSGALQFCNEFKVIQNYKETDSLQYVPVRREFIYTIREGRYNILGNTRVNHKDYKINTNFSSKLFNNEVKRFETDAFDKDSSFWNQHRPIQLKTSELEFIDKSDSIKAYYTSDEYYRKTDSAFNRIYWWSWLTGVGYKNSFKGIEFRVEGLLSQINPFGIGGYRHKLPMYFNKEFDNGMLLETEEYIDYGFKNEDFKGKFGIGLTYWPEKFMRTFIRAGDFYERINDRASIEQTFSRSNYVRTLNFSIAQRMEIVNGLFAELTFDYSDQDPINDLQLSEWSEWLFGDLNKPTDFVRYVKTEIKLEVKYLIKQQYIMKGGKKIILGTDYPEIKLVYRKGIPGLFGSEVNFDYIEAGLFNESKLARFGSSRYHVVAGSFINREKLRVLEHRYFRGSDILFFSDPLVSFQLLGPSLSTASEYFRANYIHHFEGSILNKMPLINRLKLGLAAGAGTLMIPMDDFNHFEMFAGLERVIKIKKQLFRLGVYAVTADNSIDDASYTIKVGIDFFDSFSNKWNY